MNKIIVNKIKCKKCGDIIESTYRHDFKFCKCGAVAVDGGKDYLRRIRYEEDYDSIDGLDVVSMNLANVLYDVKTKKYYTPNTGSVMNIEKGGSENQ